MPTPTDRSSAPAADALRALAAEVDRHREGREPDAANALAWVRVRLDVLVEQLDADALTSTHRSQEVTAERPRRDARELN